MKKLSLTVCMLFVISACSSNSDTANRENLINDESLNDIESVEYGIIEHSWEAYCNADDLIKEADLVVIGEITDISFRVSDITTGLEPTAETEDYDRVLGTTFSVDVLTTYKGEATKSIKIGIPGGLKNYRVEEQLKLIEEMNVYNDIIFVSELSTEFKIGGTYLFILNESVVRNKEILYGFYNPVQFHYNLDNPFIRKDGYGIYNQSPEYDLQIENADTISAKDVISAFGDEHWDSFWADWQRDNPDWETRIDKAAVEEALAES